MAAKAAAYAGAFFLAALLTVTLVGIPLVYNAVKEYGRQESVESGVPHPITLSMQKLEESCLFFKRFVRDPVNVSSVVPSSAALTAHMISKVGANDGDAPKRYLEVGAGSGVFTRAILQKMRPEDHLDVVETDPELCDLLRQMCAEHPNVQVHALSITDFHPEEQYDVIVSGLPVHGLSAEVVEGALQNYAALAKPGGRISHFEYILLPLIKRRFLFGERRQDFDRLLACKQRFIDAHPPEIEKVWGNFPPARVLHFPIAR